jgi:succinate dehydrogenase / fumarate reductase, cytochrome b subunit
MAERGIGIERPLSPHLGIYRFTITMAMSIVHRITGGALYFGTLLLVWWLLAAGSSARQFEIVSAVFASWLGQLVLFGFTWALVHHTLSGIRYLIWDTIHGLEPGQREFLSYAALIASVLLTAATWIAVYLVRSSA